MPAISCDQPAHVKLLIVFPKWTCQCPLELCVLVCILVATHSCHATGACGLACRIEPIIMSAGELEHEWAGTPGRLIRERYRKAAEVARVCPSTLAACFQ